jgi:hypothetical protein
MCPTKERNLRSSERTKPVVYIRRDVHSGDSVPRPLGFIALMPIPVNELCCWGSARRRPQPGLGPGVGAQLASQQRLILRSGRL